MDYEAPSTRLSAFSVTHYNTHNATHYNTHNATHCNTPQRTATHCNTGSRHSSMFRANGLRGTQQKTLHIFCNTLQHTQRNTLQYTATHCNTLQHTATQAADIAALTGQMDYEAPNKRLYTFIGKMTVGGQTIAVG